MNNITIRSNCHERLADALRDEFQSLAVGTRLDSIEKLSARYEVSAVTVRLALALLQGEGLVTLRHGSGSYISRPAAVTASRHIAILSEFNLLQSARGTRFHAHVMDELRSFLKANGQSSRLYIGRIGVEEPNPETLSCSEFMEDLELDRIGGVVALATLPFFPWTEQCRIKKIPIVGMGGQHPGFSGIVDLGGLEPGFNGTVDPDFPMGIHNALVRLVSNGRRRPAFIGWDGSRYERFMAAVAEVGLTPNPHWVRVALKSLEPGAGWSEFREIWAASGEKPDCVIFGNDVLFQDALPAIQATGVLIPDALEIVVMANKGIPLPRPFPYTRMDCDPAELAAAKGSLLLQCMANQPPARRQITIPYRIAVQEETCEAVEQWGGSGHLGTPHEFWKQTQMESRP